MRIRPFLVRACPFAFLALLALLLPISSSQAQPDLGKEADTSLLENTSPHYVFERFEQSSAATGQNYRIYVAIPKTPAPSNGYPVIYMLDGNAVLDALNEKWLKNVALSKKASPPLIVMIAYATRSRFDVRARAYDYTPDVSRLSGEKNEEAGREGVRKTGGASFFLDFIEDRLKPEIAKKYRIDPQRQTLWGHSYGGLFVLHALFTRPAAFQRYVAVSPSLWWKDGLFVRKEAAFAAPPRAVRLLVMKGSNESRAKRDVSNAPRKDSGDSRGSLPESTAREMTERLNGKISARYEEIDGLTHGEMLPASILPALRFAAE